MNLSSLPIHDRPRERLLEKGAESLSDAELVAILLRTGSKGQNAVELAQSLLAAHGGSISHLHCVPVSQLCQEKGVGVSKAIQFKACLELAKRALSQQADAQTLHGALERIQAETAFEQKEHFYAVFLDARNRVIKSERVASGTVNATAVFPREILKSALLTNASGIALAHNHPSGNPDPSHEDVKLTGTLDALCESMGVDFAGHFLVTPRQIGQIQPR